MPDTKPYTTGKKEEFRRLNEDGDPVTLYRIYATSKGGTRFHIELPEDQLDQAPEKLEARAKELDAI